MKPKDYANVLMVFILLCRMKLGKNIMILYQKLHASSLYRTMRFQQPILTKAATGRDAHTSLSKM